MQDDQLSADERARQLTLEDGRTVALYNVPVSEPVRASAGADRLDPAQVAQVGEAGRRSLAIVNVGLACCALEVAAAAAQAPTGDVENGREQLVVRLQPYAALTGETGVLVVSGTVTDAMAPAVRALYERLAEPRIVVSYGACSNSGGPYWDSYAVTKGVDQIVPVDLYVPGCPPRPEALLDALRALPYRLER